jgi:hypothetical protein
MLLASSGEMRGTAAFADSSSDFRDVTASDSCRRGHALFLKEALQLAGLEHFPDDIGPADELALDVKLRDRGPVGIGLDTLPELI